MNRYPANQGSIDTLNHATYHNSGTNGNRGTRPHPSLDPHQIIRSSSTRNIEGIRNEISRLTEVFNEKKDLLDSLTVTLTTARREELWGHTPALAEESVMAEISHLTKRNAFLKHKLSIAHDIEKQLASDWHVINKQNEFKAVQKQIGKIKEEIQTLEVVRQRRKPRIREIDSEVSRARYLRTKQRAYTSEARIQFKMLTDELRRITKEDIKAHDRCIHLQEQLKSGITIKELEALKKSIEEQEKTIQNLLVEEQSCRRRKEIEREEKYKVIAKEQQDCKLLENEVIELQRQLLDKDLEFHRSYQFSLS
ncbi:unnamed protein product [Phytomonas sp. EM1]|nr:unnamed protein product [Phytomonas sp. EM1]|eukprot:CCW62380.1 unnamed protein product [Phytomonas sp. isolate EM1]